MLFSVRPREHTKKRTRKNAAARKAQGGGFSATDTHAYHVVRTDTTLARRSAISPRGITRLIADPVVLFTCWHSAPVHPECLPLPFLDLAARCVVGEVELH